MSAVINLKLHFYGGGTVGSTVPWKRTSPKWTKLGKVIWTLGWVNLGPSSIIFIPMFHESSLTMIHEVLFQSCNCIIFWQPCIPDRLVTMIWYVQDSWESLSQLSWYVHCRHCLCFLLLFWSQSKGHKKFSQYVCCGKFYCKCKLGRPD